MPVYKKVNKKFFRKWNRKMAYVLGFFAADGYVVVNKRGGQFWCIQITDRELLVDIKAALNSDHKISIRKNKQPNEKNQYRLQIGSIEMCNDLRKLGFTQNKTNSLGLMAMFTSSSLPFLQHLQRNLEVIGIEGGSVYISKKNYSRLQYAARNSLKLYHFMYNDCVYPECLFLSRKKMIFERFISKKAVVV